MLTVKKTLSSTVGKKYLMGLSGLALVGFIIAHLTGNLLLLVPGGEAFNLYAKKLENLGYFLYVMEAGLIFIFLLHIVTAVQTRLTNKMARPIDYRLSATKGGLSKSTWGSRNMIITGMVLLVFLIIHLMQFKFGLFMDTNLDWTTMVEGDEARDLYAIVVTTFSNPAWAIFYVVVMCLLGFHLRHGFWSAFQSLGVAYPRFSRPLYIVALLFALLMATGFMILPIYLFLFGEI